MYLGAKRRYINTLCFLSFQLLLHERPANVLVKLANSSWDPDANTLRSSALAVCYTHHHGTVVRSEHAHLVDLHLNFIVLPALCTTTSGLPVLALRRKATVDRLIEKNDRYTAMYCLLHAIIYHHAGLSG